MYCKNCGKEIDDNANVCTYCGTAQGQGGMVPSANNDSGSFGRSVLGCCIPIVGLILFLVWNKKTEYCEKSRNRSDCWCGSQYTVLCYYLRDWNRIGKYGILLLKDACFYL